MNKPGAAQKLKDAISFMLRHKGLVKPAAFGLLAEEWTDAWRTPAIEMSFRKAGQDVSAKDLLGGAGDAGQPVVVFVHGLMNDESIWHTPFSGRTGYGPRLENDAGVRSIYVRYHTGRHISLNGRELAAKLEELVKTHPDLPGLVLIGHSMGGLVLRSAEFYGAQANHAWVRRLSKVFYLGAPFSGSDVEKVGHVTASVLSLIPSVPTRLISQIINLRSDGIKDLRRGYLVDEDWQQPAPFDLKVRGKKVPPLSSVQYFTFAGSVFTERDEWWTRLIGDGIVSEKSARAGKSIAGSDPLEAVAKHRVFGRTNHTKLIDSDEVYAAILEALLGEGSVRIANTP